MVILKCYVVLCMHTFSVEYVMFNQSVKKQNSAIETLT